MPEETLAFEKVELGNAGDSGDGGGLAVADDVDKDIEERLYFALVEHVEGGGADFDEGVTLEAYMGVVEEKTLQLCGFLVITGVGSHLVNDVVTVEPYIGCREINEVEDGKLGRDMEDGHPKTRVSGGEGVVEGLTS